MVKYIECVAKVYSTIAGNDVRQVAVDVKISPYLLYYVLYK